MVAGARTAATCCYMLGKEKEVKEGLFAVDNDLQRGAKSFVWLFEATANHP